VEDTDVLELLQGPADRHVRLSDDALGNGDIDHWLAREHTDDLPDCGIATRVPEALEPRELTLVDLVGQTLGLANGDCRGPCESLAPDADVALAVRTETTDVRLRLVPKDEADRGDVARDLLPPAQNGVDQCSTDSAVPVCKRMDVLELGVSDGGLCDRCQVIASDELAEVLEQGTHVLVRRRNVRGSDRVVVVSADPVLSFADQPGDLGILGESQQRPVDVLDVADGQRLGCRADRDCPLHRLDVAEHLGGARISLAARALVVSSGEALLRDGHSLDPRRRRALRAQQVAG
jgi:hypothetical protein